MVDLPYIELERDASKLTLCTSLSVVSDTNIAFAGDVVSVWLKAPFAPFIWEPYLNSETLPVILGNPASIVVSAVWESSDICNNLPEFNFVQVPIPSVSNGQVSCVPRYKEPIG